MQIFRDGTKKLKHDGLEYELKETYEIENILNKEGSQKSKRIVIKRPANQNKQTNG